MTENKNENIYTLPNVITAIRFLLIPIAFSVLINGNNDLLAFALFASAAATDFLDGMIARKTGTVTELGKVIDPLVDRFLIAAGALGLFLVGRLPLWTVLIILIRDFYLVVGNTYLRYKGVAKLEVMYAGKVSTAVLLLAFSGLMIKTPVISGLDWTSVSWLPGFNANPVSLWIFVLYIGIVLSVSTAILYSLQALKEVRKK